MARTHLLLALASVAMTSCGLLIPPSAVDPAAVEQLSCGGLGFPADVLAGEGSAEMNRDVAAQALRRHLETGGLEVEFLPDTGWIEARRSDDSVLYLAPDSSGDGGWASVSVERDGDEWSVQGWGGCDLQPDVGPWLGIASFRVAPHEELDPAATQLDVLVTERACASGSDALGRTVAPAVVSDDTSVTVIFAVRPRGGGNTCPSNPETPFVLELPEPLGERELLDGSSIPPRDATTCPDIGMCR
jgi:hypothetical protein